MAAMATQLAWGAISFQDGYEKAEQVQYMKECLQWATDYFIAAHTSTNELYGQVGDGYDDHAFWGRPEQMTMERPAFKIDDSHPGSDLAAETAAALAASSIFYRNIGETAMADNALQHARELYDLADLHRGIYTDHIPAADFYA
jgi:endoglucanase